MELHLPRPILDRAALRHPLLQEPGGRSTKGASTTTRSSSPPRSPASYGDARYALDLLYRAGRMADLADSPRVLPRTCGRRRRRCLHSSRKDELTYLGRHQQAHPDSDIEPPEEGRLRLRHHRRGGEEPTIPSAKSMGVAANHHTQLWNDINELSRKGIIETQISGRACGGGRRMIGLSMVSAEQLIDELTGDGRRC